MVNTKGQIEGTHRADMKMIAPVVGGNNVKLTENVAHRLQQR
jgi:hypothetical protein